MLQAIEIETEDLRDRIWEQFRKEHRDFSPEMDAKLHWKMEEALTETRLKWARVQVALDGDDAELRERAQQLLSDTIEGLHHAQNGLWRPVRPPAHLSQCQPSAEATNADSAQSMALTGGFLALHRCEGGGEGVKRVRRSGCWRLQNRHARSFWRVQTILRAVGGKQKQLAIFITVTPKRGLLVPSSATLPSILVPVKD